MRMTLYLNNSENQVVDKNITETGTADIILKEPTSITDPIITVSYDVSIINSNYVYIEDLKRYYYIRNIRSVKNNLWELTLHVDVLMSHKEDIRKQNAVLSRQEFLYNIYLNDQYFKSNQKQKIVTKSFLKGFEGAGTYVLLVVGGAANEATEEQTI